MSSEKKPVPPVTLPMADESGFSAFSLDDKTGMQIPSVTRLLNRVDIQRAMQDKKTALTPAPFRAPVAPPAAPPKPVAVAAVLPAQSKKQRTQVPLAKWKKEFLERSKENLSQAASQIVAAGGEHILSLAKNALLKSARDAWLANAAFTESAYFENCWKGLRWEAKSLPGILKILATEGVVEIEPAGPASTEEMASLRKVCGARPNEWVTLLRVGSASDFRGILLMISQKSVAEKARSLISSLATPPVAKAA